MALTDEDFITRFPEFAPAVSSGLVRAKIDEAEADVNPAVYGAKTDLAAGYLAAHRLAISPLAKNARLEDDPADGTTPYYWQFMKIRKWVAPRGFVT